ncbi:MAG: hypothetical protein ABJD53_07475 [Gammaproteobacteria bacterium]
MRCTSLRLIVAVIALSACSRQTNHATTAVAPPAPTAPTAPAAAPAAQPRASAASAAESMFDPKSNPGAVVGTFLDPHKLTESERKYGVAPKRDPRVKYGGDVIVMEEGDKAITGVGSDGMTWSFDAAAPHVSEFKEGKIVLATGRAVGRIGQITTQGNVVTVKFAPVQITDVIEEGHFIVDGDVDPKQMIVYEAPDFPSVIDLGAPATKPALWQDSEDMYPPHFQNAAFIKTQAQLPSGLGGLRAPNLTPPTVNTDPEMMTLSDALKVVPIHGSDASVGLNFSYAKSGLHIDATGKVVLNGAHVKFALDIKGFKIVTAGMKLSGATSLVLEFKSWSDKELLVNAGQFASLPADISLPVPIAGVPLALTFHTSFNFGSAFSARQSVLTASAEYTLSGSIFIGIQNNEPVITPFASVTPKVSLADDIQGVSVGINSMRIAVNVRPMIGIGAFGFNTGVYVGVGFGGSVLRQSDIVLTHCRGGYMTGDIDSGVGYQLPSAYVAVINGVLSLFTKYHIEETGTIIPGPKSQFMNLPVEIPAGCATKKQTA